MGVLTVVPGFSLVWSAEAVPRRVPSGPQAGHQGLPRGVSSGTSGVVPSWVTRGPQESPGGVPRFTN